jgi:hypothetical protein
MSIEKKITLDENQVIEINEVVLNADILKQLFVIQNSMPDNQMLSSLNNLMNYTDDKFEMIEQAKYLLVTSKYLQKVIDLESVNVQPKIR